MPFKRYVEIGRVALINFGEDYGKLVVITDVVDQNRVSAGGGGLAGSTVGCTLVGCVFGRFEGFCGVAWLAAAVVGAQAAAWVFWVCLGGEHNSHSKAKREQREHFSRSTCGWSRRLEQLSAAVGRPSRRPNLSAWWQTCGRAAARTGPGAAAQDSGMHGSSHGGSRSRPSLPCHVTWSVPAVAGS